MNEKNLIDENTKVYMEVMNMISEDLENSAKQFYYIELMNAVKYMAYFNTEIATKRRKGGKMYVR